MDPETLEISGLKPLTILPREGIHEVPGSGKKPWKIKRTKDDAYTCTCSRWQFQKGVSARLRTCSHIEAFLGPKYDAARLAMEGVRSESPVNSIAGMKRRAEEEAARDDCPEKVASDYARMVEEGKLKQGDTKPGYSHGWGGEGDHTTFNGRAITKGFDPDTAIPFMLAETYDPIKMDPRGWWMSEKLDGVRAYWTGERLISRSQRDWHAPRSFLERLPKGFALEGELWSKRDGFEGLAGICMRSDNVAWQTVSFFVFDAPDLDLPFEERLQAAKIRLPNGECSPDDARSGHFGGVIATLPQTLCKSKEHLAEYMESVLSVGGEGVMLRRRNSPYLRRRCNHVLKYKEWYDAEAMVVGFTRGTGRHKGVMGSLGLLMECGTIFTCGVGLTDQMRNEWWPPLKTIVRYRFNEMTQDGVPRFPVFEGISMDETRPRDAKVRSTALRESRGEEDDLLAKYSTITITQDQLLTEKP